MSVGTQSKFFEVDEARVARYFATAVVFFCLCFTIAWGIGLVLLLGYVLFFVWWLPQQQAAAEKYWLDGTTLRVDHGVYFLKRKGIPLDRVTDIILVQGPLMRWCDIWQLQIQTAGTGQQRPEAVLYGLVDPESVRDHLLSERDKAVQRDRLPTVTT